MSYRLSGDFEDGSFGSFIASGGRPRLVRDAVVPRHLAASIWAESATRADPLGEGRWRQITTQRSGRSIREVWRHAGGTGEARREKPQGSYPRGLRGGGLARGGARGAVGQRRDALRLRVGRP